MLAIGAVVGGVAILLFTLSVHLRDHRRATNGNSPSSFKRVACDLAGSVGLLFFCIGIGAILF